MAELDAIAVVRVLNKHRVEYVVIGGISAQLNDLPVPATVDIVFTPDGAPRGFVDLAKGSVLLELGGQTVRVITPTTWESLKQASGRPKDLAHLDSYYSAVDRDTDR